MCVTKDEIKAISKQVFHEEITEYLPMMIGKGIREAGTHMQMSPETALRITKLEEQNIIFIQTFKKITDSLDENSKYHKENNEFHESVRPLLTEIREMKPTLDSIKEASDGWSFLLNGVKKTAFIIGSLSVIFGSVYAIKEWISHS